MAIIEVDGEQIHYEVHGEGEVVLCMGGWGTFCHGSITDVPRYIRQNHRVVVFDYRSIGESTSRGDGKITTDTYAADAMAILDRLGVDRVHVVGMVGLGACVGQKIALARPALVRSLVMTGTWARPDAMFTDQLISFLDVHREIGFEAFQKMCAAFSFDAEFYETNRDRILGSGGAWAALEGRGEAHADLIGACLTHDVLDRLGEIMCPTFVVHATADAVTSPRMTQPLEDLIPGAIGYTWDGLSHIIAGREQKMHFDNLLEKFLASVPA